jgi:general secretion pathway protein F
MPAFTYKAINGKAETVEGDLIAASERDALQQLATQGLTPTLLAARSVTTGRRGKRASAEDLALVVKELATLARAGIPLAESVASIADAHSGTQIGQGFAEIRTRLNAGEPLSRGFSECGLAFPPYLPQLTQAAEFSGQLPQALEQAAQQMLYEERIRQETRSALIYPAVLVVAGVASVLFIFTNVVPKFAPLLKNPRAKVPEFSQWVIQAGLLLRDNLTLLGILSALAVVAIVAIRQNRAAREALLTYLVRVPVLGTWYLSTQVARWASVFGVLLNARVPIVRAMELAEVTVQLPALRARLDAALKSLRQGERLAAALAATRLIRPTGLNLIRVGEQSGELGNMLKALAEIEEQSGQERKRRFLALLEPACILAIGIVIAMVMYAVISAITSFNTLAF